MAASILLAIAIFGVIASVAARRCFRAPRWPRILRETDCKQPLVAAAGYHEPSLVFLAGTETRLIDGTDAADFLRQRRCRFALVESRHERSFLRRAEAIGLRYAPPSRIDGFNTPAAGAGLDRVYRSEGAP